MIVAAIILIALGLVVALLGFKLFRVLLPLVGFVSGLAVGFIGFQAVFGKGAVSTSVAIMVAVIVGIVLAILSYAFFEIAMIAIAAIIGASALSFLGIALGLDQNGFVVFLLGLAGVILGVYLASMYPVSATFVLVLTSAIGVAVLMAGISCLLFSTLVMIYSTARIFSYVSAIVFVISL